jgi:hypothetical protein
VIALRLVLLALAVPLAGLSLLDLLRCRPAHRLHAAGLGLAAGLAGLLLLLYLPMLRDGRMHLLPAALGLATGAAWQLPRLLRGRPWRPRVGAFAVALGLALLVQTVCTSPLRGYDAKAIYGLKAKALHHEGDVLGAVFQDPEVVHYHGDYPLGVPLLMALSATWTEGAAVDPHGLVAAADAEAWSARHDGVESYAPLATLWVVGLVALVAAAARRRTRGDGGAFLLVATALPLALVMPFAVGRSWSWSGADVPLVLLVTSAASVVLSLRRGASAGRLALLTLLVAASVTLKNDAVLVMASLGAAVLVTAPRGARRPLLLALGAGLILGLAPVAAVRRFGVGAPYDEQWLPAILAARPETLLARLPLLARAVVSTLLERGLAVHFGGLLLLVVPLGLARGGAARVLAVFTVVHLTGTALLFLVSPNVLAWHVDTALPRLWIHAAGPAALLTVEVLAALWMRPAGRVVAQLPPPR